MRESFVFYKSFAKAIKALDAENAKKLMEAIFDYAFEDVEQDFDNPIIEAMFALIKPQIDANNRKREAGKKGGRPKTKPEVIDEDIEIEPEVINDENQKKPKVFNSENQTEPNVNVNGKCIMENVNVNGECKNNKYEHTRGEKFLSFDEAKKNLDVQVKLNELEADEDFLFYLIAYREEIREPIKTIAGLIGLLNKFVDVKVKYKIPPNEAFEIMQANEWKTPDAVPKRAKRSKNTNLSELERAMQMIEGAAV